MDPDTVIAAVQAAALARDYVLAMTLLNEHGLGDRCLGCGGTPDAWSVDVDGHKFTVSRKFTIHETEIFTCDACTEDFARWLVDRSRDRTSSSSLESRCDTR